MGKCHKPVVTSTGLGPLELLVVVSFSGDQSRRTSSQPTLLNSCLKKAESPVRAKYKVDIPYVIATL